MLFPMFLLFLSSLLLSQENKLQVTATRAYIYADANINSSIVEAVEKGTILNQISPGKIRYIWYRVSYYSKKRSNVVLGFIQISSVEIMQGASKITEEERQKPKIIQKKPSVISVPPRETYVPKTQVPKPYVPKPYVPKTYAPKKFKLGPKSGVGFQAGYAMPAESSYSSGLKYGGNIYLGITKNVSIELK